MNDKHTTNEWLGIPTSDDDWLKYQGRCIVFVGKELVYNDETGEEEWILDDEYKTKNKLTEGLKQHGVKCESIEFEWINKCEGTVSCVCVCYYNKPYLIHDGEFYIRGLTSFDFDRENPNSLLEFYFEKL